MSHELSLTTLDECHHEPVSARGGSCSSVVAAPDEATEVIETLSAVLTRLCISRTASYREEREECSVLSQDAHRMSQSESNEDYP